jgi:hypothetical protein
MPRGVKTPKPKEYDIMVSYAITNSYNATAKQFNVSDTTVKDIIERNYGDFKKIQEEKKEDFLSRSNRIIDKMTNLLDRRVTRALDKEDEIDKTIDFIWDIDENAEDKDEKMTYKEKVALVKRLGKISLNSMNEITTSMGTVFDKARILQGGTESNETPSVTVNIVDNSNLEKAMYEED